MKDKKIRFYTIYRIVNNDLRVVMQCDTIKELESIFNKSNSYINICISKGVLINDIYLIKKDYILESEFWKLAFFNVKKIVLLKKAFYGESQKKDLKKDT